MPDQLKTSSTEPTPVNRSLRNLTSVWSYRRKIAFDEILTLGDDAVPLLCRILESETSIWVSRDRYTAVTAVGTGAISAIASYLMGADQVTLILVPPVVSVISACVCWHRLSDAYDRMRCTEALIALKKIGDAAAIGPVLAAADRASETVRAEAARTLTALLPSLDQGRMTSLPMRLRFTLYSLLDSDNWPLVRAILARAQLYSDTECLRYLSRIISSQRFTPPADVRAMAEAAIPIVKQNVRRAEGGTELLRADYESMDSPRYALRAAAAACHEGDLLRAPVDGDIVIVEGAASE